MSFGFSKFSFNSATVSATNSGSFSGRLAINAGSMVKLFSARWQVPHVLPFPLNVSLKKRSLPFATRGSPVSFGGGPSEIGGCSQATRRNTPASAAKGLTNKIRITYLPLKAVHHATSAFNAVSSVVDDKGQCKMGFRIALYIRVNYQVRPVNRYGRLRRDL